MRVKDRMTRHPITGTPEMTHREAVKIMHENDISRLPILDKHGKLVGIVSKTDLLSTSPSTSTSLSIYEIYTLLDKLRIEQFMSAPVLAVDENHNLEVAARIMVEHDVHGLPVMRGNDLVGIITETDVFKTFVEVLGGGEPGLLIDLQMADKQGEMARVMKVFADAGSYITSVTTFKDETGAYTLASIKERGADEANLRAGLDELETVKVLDICPSIEEEPLVFGKKK